MKKFIFSSILFFLGIFSFAQIFPYTYDYLLNRKNLIPASGAEDNFMSVILSYNKKWILPASPNRANLFVNMNFRHHGVNLGFYRNQVVIFNSSAVQLGYYYKTMIKRYHVSFALNGLLLQDKINYSRLTQDALSDPSFSSLPGLIFYPQFSISNFIFTDRMELGWSVNNLLKARGYSYGNLNTIYPMNFNLYAAMFYKHPLEYYLLKAQLYSYYAMDKSLLIEPSAIFVIKNFIKAGGLISYYQHPGYRSLSTGLILGLRLKNKIVINYVFRTVVLGKVISYTRVENGISITYNIYRKTEIAPRYF